MMPAEVWGRRLVHLQTIDLVDPSRPQVCPVQLIDVVAFLARFAVVAGDFVEADTRHIATACLDPIAYCLA